jgi:hypothetical protein
MRGLYGPSAKRVPDRAASSNLAPSAIIFLDFDGVLVNRESLRKASGIHANGHPSCVAALNRIIERTGAKIVISSSWRSLGFDFCVERLKAWGVKGEVIGETPDYLVDSNGLWRGSARGDEIAAWIREHDFTGRFIIIDDDSDMCDLAHRLIKTEFEEGLCERHIERAISLLTSGDHETIMTP